MSAVRSAGSRKWRPRLRIALFSIVVPALVAGVVGLCTSGYLQNLQGRHSRQDNLIASYVDQARQFQVFLAHYASAVTQNASTAPLARQELIDNLLQQRQALAEIVLDPGLDHRGQIDALERSLAKLAGQLPSSEDFTEMSKVWEISSAILVQQNSLLADLSKKQRARTF
jgi:hypothetical protein